MRASVRILRRGHVVERSTFKPATLLIDYLRGEEKVRSLKEGCRTGDCGACTVAVGRLKGGRVSYEPVNACLQLLGSVDACEVVTVEDIGWSDGTLHPVQSALLDAHASQCGFCMPGMAMSLFTLFHQTGESLGRSAANDWIAGNLCRCTGYRPIVDAALAAAAGSREDRHSGANQDTAALLGFLDDQEDIFVGDEKAFFAAPRRIDTLAELLERHPAAVLVAGGTEVGKAIASRRAEPEKIVSLLRIAELRKIEETEREFIVGPAAGCAALVGPLRTIDPDLSELLRRMGGAQIRLNATIGGNIAGVWPVPDLVPALMALGTRIELRRGRRGRWVPLEEFYLPDGTRHIAPGEFLAAIGIPKLAPTQRFRCYKLSRRFDADTAALTGGFRFTIANGTIFEARVAYGGMGGLPKRAGATEAALKGTRLGDTAAWRQAFEALKADFTPPQDFRGSARYRADMAQALLGKALIETAGTDSERTRLVGVRSGTGDGAR